VRFGLTEVIATVAPEHAASRRVLEKAGMRLAYERANDDGSRTLVYGCTPRPTAGVDDDPRV
jgi:RimJ/RimL family protein N-acetyltransferase